MLRWWDGASWSDTEFQPKSEDSALLAYIKTYGELSPRSPTNYLAVASLTQSIIALVAALALLGFAQIDPNLPHELMPATALMIASAAIMLIAIWAIIQGLLSIMNARRHGNRRLTLAIVAVVISTLSAALALAYLLPGFPAWLNIAGFSSPLPS